LDDRAPPRPDRAAPEQDTAERGAIDLWPIDPDPGLTSLADRQFWQFNDGAPVSVEVAGIRIDAGDARIADLGIRRDARARPYPAAFTHAPQTGEALGAPAPTPDPLLLDIDHASLTEVPLPSGVPVLVRAGRPAALYLFQENLGAFEVWTGRAFAALGRLPVDPPVSALTAGPEGVAYTTADALVSVALPQLGPSLARVFVGLPGLRFLSAPCWFGVDHLVLAERLGHLVLVRSAAGTNTPDLRDLGQTALGARFSGPWTNRLGDAFWTGPDGFVACRSSADAAEFVPWPEGFMPIPALAPWRDRADLHHQLGTVAGQYHLAALSSGLTPRRLDGPHLACGGCTYSAAERFDVPWQPATEALNLGAYAGALLIPLLAMVRDSVLLALPIPGPRGDFLRGGTLPAPVSGHVLHHAHGVGLRALPVSLEVLSIGDARALLHDGMLYLWSRSGRRCHALRLRPA
jgi:hypothetical protein